MAQLPGTLRHAPAYAFVGRAPELALLRSLLPRAPADTAQTTEEPTRAVFGRIRRTAR